MPRGVSLLGPASLGFNLSLIMTLKDATRFLHLSPLCLARTHLWLPPLNCADHRDCLLRMSMQKRGLPETQSERKPHVSSETGPTSFVYYPAVCTYLKSSKPVQRLVFRADILKVRYKGAGSKFASVVYPSKYATSPPPIAIDKARNVEGEVKCPNL